MIKAVIFDFFDVFRVDAYKAWLKSNGLKREGGYAEAARLQDVGEISNQEFFQKISEQVGRTVTRKDMEANVWIDAEVIKLAEEVGKNYQTALVSNAPSEVIRKILKDNDLERLFDEIVVSSEVGMVKPGAEIFQLTLGRLGVEPSEAVFTDDNQDNTDAAAQLGLHAIHYESAEQLARELRSLGVKAG